MPNVYFFGGRIVGRPDKTILINLPLTWETLCLVESIKNRFKKVFVVPLTSGENSSLQKGVFRYLKKWGVTYFENASDETRRLVLDFRPNVIIDCVFTICRFGFDRNLIDSNTLIIEDTHTGGEKLREYFKLNNIKNNFYILDDNSIKKDYENKIGIGYSVVGALISSGILLTGKNVLIVGFGPVGQGLARFCEGMGANVTVFDINTKILKIASRDYHTGQIPKIIKTSDIVITATGKNNVLDQDVLTLAKNGIVLANAGADFGEWNHDFLKNSSNEIVKIKETITLYILKTQKKIFELGGGNSINLVSGVSVSEFLDMTFSLGILTIDQCLNKGSKTQEIILEKTLLNKINKVTQIYK